MVWVTGCAGGLCAGGGDTKRFLGDDGDDGGGNDGGMGAGSGYFCWSSWMLLEWWYVAVDPTL